MSHAQLMPRVRRVGLGDFVEVDLIDGEGVLQSAAAVDSALWASSSAQITSYAQGKGLAVDEYNSAPPPGGADRNVYSMNDAQLWIDHTAAYPAGTLRSQPGSPIKAIAAVAVAIGIGAAGFWFIARR